MWYGDISEKSVLGDQLNEKLFGQQLIKKEPQEQESYCSTEKNGDLQEPTHEGTQYNSSITKTWKIVQQF